MNDCKKYYQPKVRLINKYITWNFLYSLVCFLSFLFGIILVSCFNNNLVPFQQFGGFWFYMSLALFILLIFIFWIINLYYSIPLIKKYAKVRETKSIVIYSCAIIIPFLGCIYHFVDRKILIYISNNLIGEKENV